VFWFGGICCTNLRNKKSDGILDRACHVIEYDGNMLYDSSFLKVFLFIMKNVIRTERNVPFFHDPMFEALLLIKLSRMTGC
jgi:hypothetical protein